MQRPIEFRIWDKCCEAFLSFAWVDVVSWQMQTLNLQEEYVFQQFTGLLDSKGQKIFEGDIVKYGCNTQYYESVVAFKAPSFIGQNFFFKYDCSNRAKEPRWEEYWGKHQSQIEEGYYRCDMSLTGHNYIEVIGNIFETPELLKS